MLSKHVNISMSLELMAGGNDGYFSFGLELLLHTSPPELHAAEGQSYKNQGSSQFKTKKTDLAT
jgi:hypothetical protein